VQAVLVQALPVHAVCAQVVPAQLLAVHAWQLHPASPVTPLSDNMLKP
jgi:hypothetical protein